MSALDTVLSCPDALVPYADAGILDPSDVHVAVTLCRDVDVRGVQDLSLIHI